MGLIRNVEHQINLYISKANDIQLETINIENKVSDDIVINTNIETSKIIDCVKGKISDEPWSVRYCLRIIPIQLECDTDTEKIKQNIQKLKSTIQKNDSYRITIEKRNSDISSQEMITEIASLFSNKVSLDVPDWVVLIEIFGNKTGISILKNDGMFSLEKSKRESE